MFISVFQPFFFFPQQCDIQIIFAGGFIHQRFRESTAREISSSFWLINAKSLISSSEYFPVSDNLDQSAGEWIDFIETGNCLQDNIGEFADFHFRNVALPDGAFMEQ